MFIARRIIARNIIYISKLKTYKSVKRTKIYIESSTLNIIKNKLRKKDLEKSRDLN